MAKLSFIEAKKMVKDETERYRKEFCSGEIPDVYFSMEGNKTVADFLILNDSDVFSVEEAILTTMGNMYIEKTNDSLLMRKPERRGKSSTFFEIYQDTDMSFHVSFEKIGAPTNNEIEALINAYRSCDFNNIMGEESGCYPMEEPRPEDPVEGLSEMGVKMMKPEECPTWEIIYGYDKMKSDVETNIIIPLKNNELLNELAKKTRKRYESNMPRSILFDGPGGTGKTTVATIVARESGVPLFYVPTEAVVEKWIGSSARNISYIFEAAEKFGKCILFFDEIDCLSHHRGHDDQNEESKRMLSALLRRMDGIESVKNCMIIGATNRRADLDAAMLSRFGYAINFPLPNRSERAEMFSNYAKQLNESDVERLSAMSENFSGRNIKDICSKTEREYLKIIKDSGELSLPKLNHYIKNVMELANSVEKPVYHG